jgi:hypothetical protein
MEITQDLATLEWKNALLKNVFLFAGITLVLILCFIVILGLSALQEITENWSRYRCSPYIMPFAGFFGQDSSENFQFCVKSMFEEQKGEMFEPMYGMMGEFNGTLGQVTETINGFRKTLGDTKYNINSFIGDVRSRINAVLFQIRMTFMKMQTLMGRVFGTMYSVIWMGTSAITAGMNLGDNDMVNFLFEFCFDPETPIPLQNGSIKPIKDLRIGEVLRNGKRVTSTFTFSGVNTPMVQIGKDILSSKHYVQYPSGAWGPAEGHPLAVSVASIPEIICLNVEGHKFTTAHGLVCGDYDETEGGDAAAQTIGETALNGGIANPPVADYALGIEPTAEVELQNGEWKALRTIQVGDTIGKGEVVGTVQELCSSIYTVAGIPMSEAQLVWSDGRWIRAKYVGKRTEGSSILYHLILRNTEPFHIRVGNRDAWVRDYREAPIPDMETPYMDAMEKNDTGSA